jgi:hypothetical protein
MSDPDLLGGGPPVDLRVRRVLELLQHGILRAGVSSTISPLSDGLAQRDPGVVTICAKHLQERNAFLGDVLRHGQHQPIAFGRGHGQRDAGDPLVSSTAYPGLGDTAARRPRRATPTRP